MLHRRLGPVLALLLPVLSIANEVEEPFPIHEMLVAASEAFGARLQEASGEARRINSSCVKDDFGAQWVAAFDAAAKSMILHKSRRAMQNGLMDIADCTARLLEQADCGSLASFEAMRSQAQRLRVMASSRGGLAATVDDKVKYEPMKVFTVGGIDVHLSVNGLLVAWQLKKGPQQVGKALMAFLWEFREQAEDLADFIEPNADDVPKQEGSDLAEMGPGQEKFTATFWTTVLNKAFRNLASGEDVVTEDCFKDGLARRHGDSLGKAFAHMMEKNKHGVRMGLTSLAESTLSMLSSLESQCARIGVASGAQILRSAASRLAVLASAKTLVNPGVHVEYEPLRGLKVGGIDVHQELNKFIVAWLKDQGPPALADGLASFFADFREELVRDEEEASTSGEQVPLLHLVMRDAIAAAGQEAPGASAPNVLRLPKRCFQETASSTFVAAVEAALEHMLQKRRRTMQLGLKELAAAADRLFASEPSECMANEGARVLKQGVKKLQVVTRKMVVDYGTHIKYEAMKSLTVGNVAIHNELNAFIVAWKLHSREASGKPLGDLMRKCSTIHVRDEL